MRLGLVCIAGLLGMGACGPGIAGDGDDSGAADSGEADAGTTDPTSADGTATTSADDTATTGNEVCEAILDDPASEGESTVVLRNDTEDVLYVGFDGGCALLPFRMDDPDAGEVRWKGGDCAMSCEDLLANDCFWCGPCEGSRLVRLAPGDTWELTWGGNLYERVDFPSECLDEEPCDIDCERRMVAPAPEYRIRTEARTECGMLEPIECECPDGEQTCELVMPDGIPPATMELDTVLAHPGVATLVFE